MKISAAILSLAAVILAGCASLPSQFANETPPLSKNDTNIVLAAATVRQDMPEIEIGLETSIPFALNAAIKQPATLERDGGLLYDIGEGLEAVGGTGTVSPTLVTDTASNLNTNVSSTDASLINGAVGLAQTAFAGIYAHLNALANSATNPDVKAYVLATIPIVASDIGVALVDADQQYAPTASTAMLGLRGHARLMAYAQVRAENNPAREKAAHAAKDARIILASSNATMAYLEMIETTND